MQPAESDLQTQTSKSAAPPAPAPFEHQPILHRFLHFWIKVTTQFVRNRGPVRASALAYTTLMALVPLLAISLSATALFLPRDEAKRKEKLLEWIESGIARTAPALGLGDEDGRTQRELAASNIVSFVERIHFKTIGAAATLGLLVLVIGLLRTVEVTFNDIWGVKRSRNLAVSIVYYWAAVTLGPVVILASKVANYFSYLDLPGLSGQNASLDTAITLISFGLMPGIMAMVFGALYYFMPNTRVTWQAALAGGGVAALLWTLNGQLSALYHTRVLTINAIYGSLGILPLFLIGLYFTWVIVLFGAQVACTFQCIHNLHDGSWETARNPEVREEAAVQVMLLTAREFLAGLPPPSLVQISKQLRIPYPLTHDVVEALLEHRLLNATSQGTGAFAPAKPLESITLHQILQSVRSPEQNLSLQLPTIEAALAREFVGRTRIAAKDFAVGIKLAELFKSTSELPKISRDSRGVSDS
ncbi:MAG: YihY/virulence factor BrkB family protein [Verrucomicrobiota bacterium]